MVDAFFCRGKWSLTAYEMMEIKEEYYHVSEGIETVGADAEV